MRKGELLARIVTYAVLIIGVCVMLLPIYWMVVTSLKTLDEALQLPPTWIPKSWRFSNYKEAWEAAPFGRYFFNSFFVATTTTVTEVFLVMMAGYAFAKLRFIGRETLFTVLLGTMMIPGQVLLIPSYLILSWLGWIDTYYALIIPWITSVFGIFLFRQAILTIPQDLFDAARIDGCGELGIIFHVVVPSTVPVIITAGLLKFVGSWNALLWPLIVTSSETMRTLPVGLLAFSTEMGTDYHLLSAAASFSTLPLLILFAIGQRYFIQGVTRTGLKG